MRSGFSGGVDVMGRGSTNVELGVENDEFGRRGDKVVALVGAHKLGEDHFFVLLCNK